MAATWRALNPGSNRGIRHSPYSCESVGALFDETEGRRKCLDLILCQFTGNVDLAACLTRRQNLSVVQSRRPDYHSLRDAHGSEPRVRIEQGSSLPMPCHSDHARGLVRTADDFHQGAKPPRSWKVPGAVAATSLLSRLSSAMRAAKDRRPQDHGRRSCEVQTTGIPKSRAMRSTSYSPQHANSVRPEPAPRQFRHHCFIPSIICPGLVPGCKSDICSSSLPLSEIRNELFLKNSQMGGLAIDPYQRAPAGSESLHCNFMGRIARRIDFYQDARAARGR